MDKKYISDIVDMTNIKKDEFNIIASGCGTGKSYFIGEKLLEYFENIMPYQVLFLTSRAIIVDQQSQSKHIDKYDIRETELIDYWNEDDDADTEYLQNKGITIMTYDKLIDILLYKNNENSETLKNVKIIVIDECHTLFSDSFIGNIDVLKVWIRDNLYDGEKTFIGLTATPNILFYYQSQWGVKLNQLNKEILIQYKAKQLHCTNFDTIPYIIATNRLQGRTIIMCNSLSDCITLQDILPNAAILVSKNNEYYKNDLYMWNIRDTIVKKRTLPETFMYPVERDKNGFGTKFEERKLEILLTTSTLREGINLDKESGIRNVVCCYQDELHITQFMGRCRYNIDNLVVVDVYNRSDNLKQDTYLWKNREAFKRFVSNKSNVEWFDSVSHLLEHDCYDTKRFILGTDEKKFINYINHKWLVPIGKSDNEMDEYKIWKQKDKDEIVNMAVNCKLYPLYRSQITFNKVINTLTETLGYDIITDRQTVCKKKHTYKLIISFDEDRIIFVKPYKGIND